MADNRDHELRVAAQNLCNAMQRLNNADQLRDEFSMAWVTAMSALVRVQEILDKE